MIIAFSGKQGSGKDLAGKIVQYLIYNNHRKNSGFNEIPFHQYDDGFPRETSWTIHKFADKLKDCVCLILGCTRKQLEDREYKETELGEEWWFNNIVPENGFGTKLINWDRDLKPQKMTPRLLLQLLGTECGRHIIHPNIWVNATMVDYRDTKILNRDSFKSKQVDIDNWIFTDVRFPNECEAIKKHNGIVIRLQRLGNGILEQVEHLSETALDFYKFNYIIYNNSTIEYLIEQIKLILIKEKII